MGSVTPVLTPLSASTTASGRRTAREGRMAASWLITQPAAADHVGEIHQPPVSSAA